jgi:hypothetical protein
MPRGDSLSIPRATPLATGWRSQIAAILQKHGLANVMDAVVAFAELCCQADPDDCSAAEESAQGGWYRPAKRRIDAKAERLAAFKRSNRFPHPKRIKTARRGQ